MPSPTDPSAWVDLHVHYLPGIDDGPATLNETLAMLRLAYDTGSRTLVATPHLYSFVAETLRPDDVRAAFARTRDELLAAAARPEHAFLGEMSFREGAENHLGPELLADLERDRAVTLDRTRNVLVELPPFLPFAAARRALERIAGWGYVPVLAHVERYPMLLDHPEQLGELLAMGCIAQINAATVAGASGRPAARQALGLLQNGQAAIVASDGHNVGSRPPDLGAAATALAPEASPALVARWLGEAPAGLLRGQ